VFYDSGIVSVDDKFARFGETAYAINKITSTSVHERKIKGAKGWLIWLPLALFFTLPMLVMLVVPMTDKGGTVGVMAIPVVVFWLLTIRSWRRRKATMRYSLMLVTSAQQVQAMETEDLPEIQKLRSAIEQAMST
jgi:hypothetical protein